MKQPEQLWRGVFMYSHEMIIKFSHAPNERAAKMRMINQLAKEHGVHASVVFSIFDGSKDNYRIEIDKKWRLKNDNGIC